MKEPESLKSMPVENRLVYHALDLNSSWVISRMKNPFWKRLFFGGSISLLLLHGFGFESNCAGSAAVTAFDFGLFSRVLEAANGASVVGETRLGCVPMALEIESNGLMGRETGNEGVRREMGDTRSLLLSLQVIPLIVEKPKAPAGVRVIVPEERARLEGKVVNTGSWSSLSSRISVERSSSDEEEADEHEREDMLNAGGFADKCLEARGNGGLPESVMDDEGVSGDSSADDDEQSESALSECKPVEDRLRGARRLAGSATRQTIVSNCE